MRTCNLNLAVTSIYITGTKVESAHLEASKTDFKTGWPVSCFKLTDLIFNGRKLVDGHKTGRMVRFEIHIQ